MTTRHKGDEDVGLRVEGASLGGEWGDVGTSIGEAGDIQVSLAPELLN